MPLATDELVRKATTLTTTVASLIPKLWAPVLETNLRNGEVFQQSIITDTTLLEPNSGDTAYIPILPDLTELDALTEGVDMTIYALSQSTSIPLVPTEYGKTIEITRKAIDRMKYDAVAAIMDRLAYSVTLKIEGAIAALWNASTPAVIGAALPITSIPVKYVSPITSVTGGVPVYGPPRTTATITSADTFNDKLILDGVTALKKLNNIPFPDGYFRLYINPDQYEALILDPNVRQDLRYASPQALLNGEVGVLHGCRIVVTNFIKSQTENTSVTVYDAMLLSPRWAAIEYKRRPEIVVDPNSYDMGRRRRFGVTADFDIELIHPERAVVLKSA
jgi:hypothetical protein